MAGGMRKKKSSTVEDVNDFYTPPQKQHEQLRHSTSSRLKRTPQVIARFANNMLFELSKSHMKVRMQLGLMSTVSSAEAPLVTMTMEDKEHSQRVTPRCTLPPHPLSSASSRKSSRLHIRDAHSRSDLHDLLSSVLVSPNSSFISLSKSTPNLQSVLVSAALMTATRVARVAVDRPLTDLPEEVLLRITKLLDGPTVFKVASTCRKLRRLMTEHADEVAHRTVSSRELLVDADRHHGGRPYYRLTRIPRRLTDGSERGSFSLDDLLPPLTFVEAKVTFSDGVNVFRLRDEFRLLYKERRLAPVAFHFTGGANTKGSRICGADLRQFSVDSFVKFCSSFYPVLKEVQMASTRHFRMCSQYASRMLSFVALVEDFGCVYERPALCFEVDDLATAVEHWRTNPLSHSCTLYVRRPHVSNGEELEKAIKGASVNKITRGGEDTISSLMVSHSLQSQLFLSFVFH